MNSETKIAGIVKNGSFISSSTKKGALLTTVHMQEAVSTESGKIDLTQYEGKSLLIECQRADDDWIWGTKIVDVGGPLLTLVISKLFELN